MPGGNERGALACIIGNVTANGIANQMFAAGDWVEIGWVSRAADFRYEMALSATQAPLVPMRRHGLENRSLPRVTRGFESHPLRHLLDASLTLRTARTISVVST